MESMGSWPNYGTKSAYGDIESGSLASPDLRWGFIRKVYGILAAQMTLTFVAASWVVLNHSVTLFVVQNSWIIILAAVLPFVLICALSAYHQHHPLNLILLGLFSLSFSVTLGLSCAFIPGPIVLEALFLTALITVSLTAYTFWAAKRGQDFEFLGPALFTALLALVGVSFIQIFFPFGSLGTALVAGGGAVVFSLYIVYDTNNILQRFSYDDYIWASLALYLDIINLFSYLLELLSALQGDRN